MISIFCIGIIFFIFMTRCKVSKIQLKMKDASLILIFFALLAYINGHEYLFIILLFSFSIIYFTPQHYFESYLSKFLGKKDKKIEKEILKDTPQEPTIDTIETDIEIDDNITIDEQDDEDEQDEQIVQDNRNDQDVEDQNNNQNESQIQSQEYEKYQRQTR
jgi:hypothetical protein